MEEEVSNPILEIFSAFGDFAPIVVVLGVLGFGYFAMKQGKKRQQASKQRFQDYVEKKDIRKIDIVDLNNRTPDLIDKVDRGDYQGGIQRDKIDLILQKEKDVQEQMKQINDAAAAGKSIADAWKRLKRD